MIRRHGNGWQVRWSENGIKRGRTFKLKADAELWESEVKRRKQLGQLASLNAGTELLSDFVEEWWEAHGTPNLAHNTQSSYAYTWDKHVLPKLGGYRLRDLSPKVIDKFRVELAAGGIGDPAIYRAMAVLQSVLSLAVRWERIPTNPVSVVRKPAARRKTEVRPPTPELIEAIRKKLLARGEDGLRDATLVSVIAYAGLRPGEALKLDWYHVRKKTLHVEGSISVERRTKTSRNRTVALLSPLIQDLAQWKLASERPTNESHLLFPKLRSQYVDRSLSSRLRKHTGPEETWQGHDYKNWQRRVYSPIAKELGAPARPYDLRHAFVSLLINEGHSISYVAEQAGHSKVVCLETYAHVFDEFDPSDRLSAEEVIWAARKPKGRKRDAKRKAS